MTLPTGEGRRQEAEGSRQKPICVLWALPQIVVVSKSSTRSVAMNLARPFKAGNSNLPDNIRRVATDEIAEHFVHCVADATRGYGTT